MRQKNEPPDVVPVGTVLGDTYKLTRMVGYGGMGAVFEAKQLSSGKRVAVKVMSRELAAYEEALARFRREVKVTTELAHPNIIDVVDFGSAPSGEPYLVMEFLEGEDLERCLTRVERLRLSTAVQIVNQLASALAVAHGAGVVHRDLKPANVFLVRVPGGQVFIKVLDFGISKVLKASTTQLTMARAVVGTPEFMAPEQAAGRVDQIDHRTDQWSLACVAWQMVSGYLPFNNQDVNGLLEQVMSGEPTPLGPYADRIPPELGKVLRRALSKKREGRFPTITAFARAFEAAVTGKTPRPLPVAVSAQELPRIEPPRPRRSRRLIPMTIVGLLLAMGAAWFLGR
jgi:eukaryotic-like serine/threonine-protein kinase